MPMPPEYFHAARDFDAFLADAMKALDLQTRHQTWQTVLAVFVALRDRLDARQGVVFATALPPLLRAAFLEGWVPSDPPKPFGTPDDQVRDVLAFRPDHNLSPPDAVDRLAPVLMRHVDLAVLEQALSNLPAGVRSFWRL